MCVILFFSAIDPLLVQLINPYLVKAVQDPSLVQYHSHMGDFPCSILKESKVALPDLMNEING